MEQKKRKAYAEPTYKKNSVRLETPILAGSGGSAVIGGGNEAKGNSSFTYEDDGIGSHKND